MLLKRRIFGALWLTLLLSLSCVVALGQDKSSGGIKGRVRVDTGSTPENVSVIVRQGEREVRRAETNGKGEFNIQGLAPGLYGVTLRKPGLSIRTLEKLEVRAGKTYSISDRNLFLPIDTGSLAYIRGSVFSEEGRSIPGARVELSLVQPDGTTRKIDGRVTSETGMFQFHLTPEHAHYLITVKTDRWETATKEVEVEGAGRNNIAITLHPTAK